jgi:hypothetical protein
MVAPLGGLNIKIALKMSSLYPTLYLDLKIFITITIFLTILTYQNYEDFLKYI